MGCSDIARGRLQSAFVVLEDTCGTLQVAEAADFVMPNGDANMNQSPDYTNSEEKLQSLDVVDRTQNSMPTGTWSLPFKFRTSGTAGTAPAYDSLFQTVGPDKTITEDTSVTYGPAIDYAYASIWMQFDHLVLAMSGCTLNSLTIPMDKDGDLMATAAGAGMRMYWAGTDAVSTGAAIGAESIALDDASKYSPGMYIYNYTETDHDTGAGYKILTVNTTTNIITLASGIAVAWEVGDVIKGYVPTGVKSGNTIKSNDAVILLDSASFPIKSGGSINLGLPVEYITDEFGNEYPEAFVEDVRDISIDLNFYLRQDKVGYLTSVSEGDTVDLSIVWGSAGDQVQIDFDYVVLGPLSIEPGGATVGANMTGTALGSGSGENSYLLTFK